MQAFHSGHGYPTLTPTPADGATTQPIANGVVCAIDFTGTERPFQQPYTTLRFGTTNPPDVVLSSWPGAHGYESGDVAYRFRYTPVPLIGNTTYYWQVAVGTVWGYISGPVWSFTTEDTMVLDRDVTLQDVVNTAVETTVYTFSVPGGTLSTNSALRLTILADYLNNSGSARSFTVRVNYGGTLFAICILSAGNDLPADANRRSFRGEVVISAANAANAQVSVHSFNMGATGTATNGSAAPFAHFQGAKNNGAIDSSVSQTLAVTFTHSAADVNLSARALAVWLERL